MNSNSINQNLTQPNFRNSGAHPGDRQSAVLSGGMFSALALQSEKLRIFSVPGGSAIAGAPGKNSPHFPFNSRNAALSLIRSDPVHVGTALENIRERLSLHSDAAASLKTGIIGNVFQPHLILAYIQEANQRV